MLKDESSLSDHSQSSLDTWLLVMMIWVYSWLFVKILTLFIILILFTILLANTSCLLSIFLLFSLYIILLFLKIWQKQFIILDDDKSWFRNPSSWIQRYTMLISLPSKNKMIDSHLVYAIKVGPNGGVDSF